MATHEITDGADNWYTPKWIMDKFLYTFGTDPCAGKNDFVPSVFKFYENGLDREWLGTVWLNPPFGSKRFQIVPWLEKFLEHGNGISIVPNRTATEWWQEWAERCDHLVFLKGKVKFIKDGKEGASPGYGSVLGSVGACTKILRTASFEGLNINKL